MKKMQLRWLEVWVHMPHIGPLVSEKKKKLQYLDTVDNKWRDVPEITSTEASKPLVKKKWINTPQLPKTWDEFWIRLWCAFILGYAFAIWLRW